MHSFVYLGLFIHSFIYLGQLIHSFFKRMNVYLGLFIHSFVYLCLFIHSFVYLGLFIHLIVYSSLIHPSIHPSAGLRNSLGLQTGNGGAHPRAGPSDQTRPVWWQKEQPVPDLAGHGRLESCSRSTETSRWLHWYFVRRKLCDQFLYPPHTTALQGQCVGCVRKWPPANKVNQNWNSNKAGGQVWIRFSAQNNAKMYFPRPSLPWRIWDAWQRIGWDQGWITGWDRELRGSRSSGHQSGRGRGATRTLTKKDDSGKYAAKKSRCNGRSHRHRHCRGPSRSWNNSLLFGASYSRRRGPTSLVEKCCFPQMSRVARKYLCVCATSTPLPGFSAPQVKLSVHNVPC